MQIQITLQDTNDLSFQELHDALSSALEDNGIDASDENCQIVDTDQQGDPNEVEDLPKAPPATTKGSPAGLGGPTSATLPMSGAGPTQGVA